MLGLRVLRKALTGFDLAIDAEDLKARLTLGRAFFVA
jgi:hypothetical protein